MMYEKALVILLQKHMPYIQQLQDTKGSLMYIRLGCWIVAVAGAGALVHPEIYGFMDALECKFQPLYLH